MSGLRLGVGSPAREAAAQVLHRAVHSINAEVFGRVAAFVLPPRERVPFQTELFGAIGNLSSAVAIVTVFADAVAGTGGAETDILANILRRFPILKILDDLGALVVDEPLAEIGPNDGWWHISAEAIHNGCDGSTASVCCGVGNCSDDVDTDGAAGGIANRGKNDCNHTDYDGIAGHCKLRKLHDVQREVHKCNGSDERQTAFCSSFSVQRTSSSEVQQLQSMQ